MNQSVVGSVASAQQRHLGGFWRLRQSGWQRSRSSDGSSARYFTAFRALGEGRAACQARNGAAERQGAKAVRWPRPLSAILALQHDPGSAKLMADVEEEVGLSHEAGCYTLYRKDAAGNLTQIDLTGTNLLALLPLIQRACSQMLQDQTNRIVRASSGSAIVPMTAKGFDVNVDLFHKDEVFLTLADAFENHFSFAMSPTDALMVAKRLAEKVRELDQSQKPPSTRQ